MNMGYTPQQLADEFNVDLELTEHEGFSVGETVEAIRDNEDEGYYRGDRGPILGFARIGAGMFNPTPRIEAIVEPEGMDALGMLIEDIDSFDPTPRS